MRRCRDDAGAISAAYACNPLSDKGKRLPALKTRPLPPPPCFFHPAGRDRHKVSPGGLPCLQGRCLVPFAPPLPESCQGLLSASPHPENYLETDKRNFPEKRS